ncbi:unnamed protein product [Didymodactylos carnosus]|uniref:Uncharacterized protein n=1 Tax=Didymodactylos carnosus TaxID=1234261 RepID=A0A813W7W7_9BILA|nr:unnamed protein product [Didymodactylos carnosus]CAF1133341.1 unnamed protein product [Didymodactylos carnosus]CAF3641557.1 unnamed protein product [Didymodactylos carnosus]CAF3919265.1 unnamed protein product [Didymodactylos carnosus]
MTSSNINQDWNNVNLYHSARECDETKVTFESTLPIWLNGTLFRNGPGHFELDNEDPPTTVYHSFDGFAYVQKYVINGENNEIKFQTTFVKSRMYEESLKEKKLYARTFGTDPCKSIFGRFQSLFIKNKGPKTFTDDTGVTIQRINNELVALTETIIGYIIDESTMETIAPLITLPYAKPIQSEIMTLTTAHVMYDVKRHMTVGYASRITRSKGYWLDVIFIHDDAVDEEKNEQVKSADVDDEDDITIHRKFTAFTNTMSERGKAYNRNIKSKTKVYRFDYDNPCYMHSASISEDYLILSEIPLHFSLVNAAWATVAGGILTDMFKWNGATCPTYFRIISLDNGQEIARIPGPSFFTFHHINAYQVTTDDADEIVVDICAYDDHRLVRELYLDKLRANIFPSGLGYIRRFNLNLKLKQCTEPSENKNELPEQEYIGHPIGYRNSLVPVPIELPRINSDYIGKSYRYVYAVRGPPNYMFDALVKIDLQTQTVSGLWIEPCTSPSEPIFVPKPNSTEEDEGVVLTVVLEQKRKQSFILILDGQSFKEITRAYLPISVPLSFHGNFY